MFQLITIDLDGTLVDTVHDLHAAVNDMLESLGLAPSSVADVQNWVGNGIEILVHRALTGSMDERSLPEVHEQALKLFSSAYHQTNGQHARLYPGVKEGLEWLSNQGVPLVCVTNKAGRYSRPLLDTLKIADYFDYHIAGDDVQKKKPDPQALIVAAKLCSASPSHSLMIGDSVSDIKAARAAGFKIICVSYGYNHNVPIHMLEEDLQPDRIIDTFAQLKKLPEMLSTYPA